MAETKIYKYSPRTNGMDCPALVRGFLRGLGSNAKGPIGTVYGEIWVRRKGRNLVAVGSTRESVQERS